MLHITYSGNCPRARGSFERFDRTRVLKRTVRNLERVERAGDGSAARREPAWEHAARRWHVSANANYATVKR